MRGGTVVTATAAAVPSQPDGRFSNTPLISTWSPPPELTTSPIARSTGNSEPAIAFGSDGRMAVDGLGWLPFQVNLWTGRFGATPTYFGAMDQAVNGQGAGRGTVGDGDADVEITSTGAMHLADLDIIFSPTGKFNNLGVSVTNCPRGSTEPVACEQHVLDQAGTDRPWITSLGQTLWVAYHDAKNSTMIRVKKSTDDGRTWTSSGFPVVAQGRVTSNSMYNNSLGPIVADPTTGDVFEGFMAGEPQTRCCSADFNNVYVSRSTDGGAHYTATPVYHAPAGTRLNNFWPATAVDPVTGEVLVTWTDQHGVFVASSSDHGEHWSAPTLVSNATTTVMPWIAARAGKVDVVYYGSAAASPDDPAGVWNTYDSQRVGGAWSVARVSNAPNRIGRVCLEGSGCVANQDRELLDLFEVAEDPASGKAAIIYTSSQLNTYTISGDPQAHELPEMVLAYEQ